jgi:hypothetical protein
MKLSSNTTHPDYHPVAIFIDHITCDGTKIDRIVHVDTELGELQIMSMPLKVVNNMVNTHVIYGKVEIVWREPLKSPNGAVGTGSQQVMDQFKADWEQRELLRKQETMQSDPFYYIFCTLAAIVGAVVLICQPLPH